MIIVVTVGALNSPERLPLAWVRTYVLPRFRQPTGRYAMFWDRVRSLMQGAISANLSRITSDAFQSLSWGPEEGGGVDAPDVDA